MGGFASSESSVHYIRPNLTCAHVLYGLKGVGKLGDNIEILEGSPAASKKSQQIGILDCYHQYVCLAWFLMGFYRYTLLPIAIIHANHKLGVPTFWRLCPS